MKLTALITMTAWMALTACGGEAPSEEEARTDALRRRTSISGTLTSKAPVVRFDCGHDNGTCTCTNDDDCDDLFTSGRCVDGTERWYGEDDGVCDDSHD